MSVQCIYQAPPQPPGSASSAGAAHAAGIVILAHGGGDVAYTLRHPLAQMAVRDLKCAALFSLQLPFHGPVAAACEPSLLVSRRLRSHQPPLASAAPASPSVGAAAATSTGAAAADQFDPSDSSFVRQYGDAVFQALAPALQSPHARDGVTTIGYSLGGLTLLHLWPRIVQACAAASAPPPIGVFVGVALSLELSGTAVSIQQFWTRAFFERRGQLQKMEALHSSARVDTMTAFARAYSGFAESLLLPDAAARRALLGAASGARVHFVSGELDEPYPFHSCVHLVLERDGAFDETCDGGSARALRSKHASLAAIPDCGHFNYFHATTWPRVRELILRACAHVPADQTGTERSALPIITPDRSSTLAPKL
jgi:hypothetical protein